MKKITCALTILMLMIMLCACGNDAGTGGAAMGAAISGTYAPQLEAASTDASEIAQTEAANVPAESAALPKFHRELCRCGHAQMHIDQLLRVREYLARTWINIHRS